jgi:hypothetical protein
MIKQNAASLRGGGVFVCVDFVCICPRVACAGAIVFFLGLPSPGIWTSTPRLCVRCPQIVTATQGPMSAGSKSPVFRREAPERMIRYRRLRLSIS